MSERYNLVPLLVTVNQRTVVVDGDAMGVVDTDIDTDIGEN